MKDLSNISPEEQQVLQKILQKIANQPDLIADNNVLKSLIAKIYKTAKKQNRQANQHQKRQEDFEAKSQTFIFKRNDELQAALPTETKNITPKVTLNKSVRCYVCKEKYNELHFFYHQLCPKCGDFNFQKRQQSTDLKNRVALITGGRVKIGYELALKLLRDGALVIVTTRFPQNAWSKFLKEKDAEIWKNRLFIYGLDLRNLPSVEQFVEQIKTQFDYLDIIINNAAQTIKRPIEFYQHLLQKETETFLLEAKKEDKNLIPQNPYFPIGMLDKELQQVDLRKQNSWVKTLDNVDSVEMLEVQLVNNLAPFMLNSQLKSMLLRSPFERKFIINVSAVEGQFGRENKTVFHPHTNMAKAALNMMTRTSAADYATDNIFMNSVDTGWITDENPHPKKSAMRKNGFVPPLDIIDGAMRVYAPIVHGLNKVETPVFGHFLKDYKITNW